MFFVLGKGILLGLAIAAPVGPIGLLCIRRTLIVIFAGLGITQSDYLQSVTLVFGVFSGSLLWWLVLVSGVAYLRRRLTPRRLARFNRFSSKLFGLVLFGFGIAALLVSV